jgi:hypothetical protein
MFYMSDGNNKQRVCLASLRRPGRSMLPHSWQRQHVMSLARAVMTVAVNAFADAYDENA